MNKILLILNNTVFLIKNNRQHINTTAYKVHKTLKYKTKHTSSVISYSKRVGNLRYPLQNNCPSLVNES